MDHDRSTLSPGIPNGARMASEGMTMAAARPDPEIAAVARRRRGSAGEKRVLMVAASPPGEVAIKDSARSEASLLRDRYAQRDSQRTTASRPRLHPNASLPAGSYNRAAVRLLSVLRAVNREAKPMRQ